MGKELNQMKEIESQKIFLNGYIDVPNDRIAAVKSALSEHISLTRAENGCIMFEVVSSDTVPGRFMVSEVFVNQSAFDAHQERTKNSDWYNITAGIPREYCIKAGDVGKFQQ